MKKEKKCRNGKYLLPPPWIACAWLEILPGVTMGSIRARPEREWHSMRQKASAVPERMAAAADSVVMDFMVEI